MIKTCIVLDQSEIISLFVKLRCAINLDCFRPKRCIVNVYGVLYNTFEYNRIVQARKPIRLLSRPACQLLWAEVSCIQYSND